MKEVIARKKDAHYKEICKSRTKAIRARYKNMKNRAKMVGDNSKCLISLTKIKFES